MDVSNLGHLWFPGSRGSPPPSETSTALSVAPPAPVAGPGLGRGGAGPGVAQRAEAGGALPGAPRGLGLKSGAGESERASERAMDGANAWGEGMGRGRLRRGFSGWGR